MRKVWWLMAFALTGTVLVIGTIGCDREKEGKAAKPQLVQESEPNVYDTPNDASVVDMKTEPSVANSAPSHSSPLFDLPLQIAINRTENGLQLAVDGKYNPFIQLTLHVQSKDYVVHVIRRMDERAEWTLYRQDLAVVYPNTGQVQVYPMTSAYITDSYSVDSLGYGYEFADDEHIVFPSATGNEPGKMSAFQIVRMNVRTGEREVLFDQQPEVVQPDFYNTKWIAYSGDGPRLAINSFKGGKLSVYDLQNKTAKKLEGYPNSWPLSRLFPSPDGNLFWYGAGEELKLFDLDGNQRASFPRAEGYGQYPPIGWSMDGEYSVYPYTFDQNDEAVISAEDGVMEIAPEGIAIFDRSGKKIRELKVARGSKRHFEIAGWFPTNGLAVIHEYGLDHESSSSPQKINSSYKMLDVRTGAKTALKGATIGDLKRPFAMKIPSYPYPAEKNVLIVDPDSKQYWTSDRPAILFDNPESKYMYWIAFDYSASRSTVYRYSLDDRELKQVTLNRTLQGVAVHGNWLIDTDQSVINYTDLDPLF